MQNISTHNLEIATTTFSCYLAHFARAMRAMGTHAVLRHALLAALLCVCLTAVISQFLRRKSKGWSDNWEAWNGGCHCGCKKGKKAKTVAIGKR